MSNEATEFKGIRVAVARVKVGRGGLTVRYQAICHNCAKAPRKAWPIGRQVANAKAALFDVRRHALRVRCHEVETEAVTA